MDKQNLTLLTDFYELTMMQGYYNNNNNETVIFDVFYRENPSGSGYAICAGLDQVIDYIKELKFTEDDIEFLRNQKIFNEGFLEYLKNFRFTGDIYAIPEGTVVFPMEPLVKVIAPIMEAQLVETALLNIVNHQSLIATKASRVVYAAGGQPVMEFGLRRAQGPDAGTLGARAAVIGGCIGTSKVLAAKFEYSRSYATWIKCLRSMVSVWIAATLLTYQRRLERCLTEQASLMQVSLLLVIWMNLLSIRLKHRVLK